MPTEEIQSLVNCDDAEDWNDDKDDYSGFTEEELALSCGITDFSDIKIQHDIDDIFGRFGFKDKNGNVIIEPQYVSAGRFSHGLCNVCLNRTRYTDADGARYYETHWGYIDTSGKTVIPFKFREAMPFNRYGVAVVCDEYETGGYLIDTRGNPIENTQGLHFSFRYDYTGRYMEFSPIVEKKVEDPNNTGLYDTKERRILFPAKAEGFVAWSDDFIEVNFREAGRHKTRFINSRGEYIHEWLNEYEQPELRQVRTADVAIVGAGREQNKNSGEKLIYGVAHRERGIVIPCRYESIQDLGNGIFACTREDICEIIDMEKVL